MVIEFQLRKTQRFFTWDFTLDEGVVCRTRNQDFSFALVQLKEAFCHPGFSHPQYNLKRANTAWITRFEQEVQLGVVCIEMIGVPYFLKTDPKERRQNDNKIGPKTEPCDTLLEMGTEEEHTVSILTEGDWSWM